MTRGQSPASADAASNVRAFNGRYRDQHEQPAVDEGIVNDSQYRPGNEPDPESVRRYPGCKDEERRCMVRQAQCCARDRDREDSRYEQVEGAMPDAWNRPRDADQRSLQCASPAAQICPYRHCDYGVHQNLPQGGEDDGSRLLVGLGEYPRGLLGNEKIPGDAQHQPDPHRQKEKRDDVSEEYRKRLAYDAPYADPSVGPIRAGRVEVRWIGLRVHTVAASRRRRDARLFRSDLSVGHAYVPIADGGDDRPAGSDQSFHQKGRHSQQHNEVVLSKVAGHAFEQRA